MNTKQTLTVIYGSDRPGRFCDTVVNWALRGIHASGLFEVTTLDPKQLALTPQAPESDDALVTIRQVLQASDAVLVVTPEYNHSFPAVLKQVIDAANEEWHVKPVAFVSYGGISGGIRAVEQLRQVFIELHAVNIRASVPLPNAWELFDSHGALYDPERRERSLAAMLAQLHWWSAVLRNARTGTQVKLGEV